MDKLVETKYDVSESLKLLKIHKRMYLGGVNGGLLQDHIFSLKYGLQFLRVFLNISQNEDLIQRSIYLVSNVKQKLYSLRYLGKDESLVMKLEQAYADLREEMKTVIINPRTNEYDFIIPKIFTPVFVFSEISIFLREKIRKLATSDCKADQITPMMKELEAIRKMLKSLLEPFFIYVKDVSLSCKKEKVNEVFAALTIVLDRATRLIYLSFVRKMDDEMVISLKNSLSDIIVEEAQIMNMYLSLDMDSSLNPQSDISMSLMLLRNRKFYMGIVMEAALEDHFMIIKHGLQFLVRILEISEDIDLNQNIQHVVAIVKHKLYSLSRNHEDKNLAVNLEHAFGELREEMKNVVINPGKNEYYTIFPENQKALNGYFFGTMKDFLLGKIQKLVTSSSKSDKIAPMMKEMKELRKKLTSFEPLFDYVSNDSYAPKEEEIFAALTTFLDRATCLIYLSFIGNWNEEMLVSARKTISSLTEETEIKEMSLGLGIVCEDLQFHIDISQSLLERQEDYHKATMNGSMLKDHIMSLKHGIGFLEWFPIMIIDRDFERCIILLAGNVKQKLESLTYEQGLDVSGAYADLREEMKNIIMDVNGAINKYSTLFPKQAYIFRNNDFLLEKITILASLNCKADQIAPFMKELQDLRKMLTSLKPLCLCLRNEEKILITLLTIHRMATFLIYVSFVAKMDVQMVLFVKSGI